MSGEWQKGTIEGDAETGKLLAIDGKPVAEDRGE